jgi:hypothetical protein
MAVSEHAQLDPQSEFLPQCGGNIRLVAKHFVVAAMVMVRQTENSYAQADD